MFGIKFCEKPKNEYTNAIIINGDFKEDIYIDLSYCSKEKYLKLWRKELEQLLYEKEDYVFLFTGIYPFLWSNFWSSWFLWKKGDIIYLSEKFMFIKFFDRIIYLLHGCNIEKYLFYRKRKEYKDLISSERKISKWEVKEEDLKEFLKVLSE